MALNPSEYRFAINHYSCDVVAQISRASEAFNTFDNQYIYRCNSFAIAYWIRSYSNIAKLFNDAIDGLLPFSDNLVAKCMLAKLYYHKFEYESYQTALKYAQEGAEAGLAEAQLLYGRFLLRESDANRKLALSWFMKAAEQGHPEAKCCMGNIYKDLYYEEERENINYIQQANHYFSEAETMEGSCWWAMLQINHYRNPGPAKEVLESIADQYPLANHALGVLYMDDRFGYIDYEKAYNYLKKGDSFGIVGSYEHLAKLYDEHLISGPESAEYWIGRAAFLRKIAKQYLYERDHVVPEPFPVSSGIRPIYEKYGYSDLLPANSAPTTKSSRVLSWILGIVICLVLVKMCT